MENFIVSARKYRPATFRSVVGQDHITSTLANAISRGQLAHAYLFCGPRGVGKTTCARIFAKAINCLGPVDGVEACGECESCRSFDEGRSFNIHELDAASNNSVDDIRSLTDQVRIPPQLGRYSVYIIDEVHMLSAAAFNAFLKTLEEPPAHAIFILATTEKHKIIPTILSRCQIFDFNRIRVADGVEYMRYIADTEGVKYDEESLNLIARKADGGMRDALSMFDKAVSFCGPDLQYKAVAQSLNILDYDTYFGVVDLIVAGDYNGALMALDAVLAGGFSGQTFMAGLAAHLRDLLVAKNAQTIELLDVTGSLLGRYQEQAARCGIDFLFSAIALLADLDAKIRVATNQRLVVELALMKLCGMTGVQPSAVGGVGPTAPSEAGNSAPEPEKKKPEVARPEGGEGCAENLRADAAPSGGLKQVSSPAGVGVASPMGISGRPLSEIIGGRAGSGVEEKKTEVEASKVDPEAVRKIEAARGKFLERLAAERPRLAVAFGAMEVAGGAGGAGDGGGEVSAVVRVRVPSQALREEVLRQRTEILTMLVGVAGVDGAVELEAIVDESTKPTKPIKIEDKLRHLSELNPQFNTLRKALELEIE